MSNLKAFGSYFDRGMTLRDYFAGQALPALITEYYRTQTPRDITERAYKVADLMLQAGGN